MKPELNEEFTRWYERFFLQSPRLASLQYDDEKMWEAWKAGYNQAKKEVEKLDKVIAEARDDDA